MNSTNFEPDWVSPPGDTIALLLEQRRVPRQTLATSLQITSDELRRLLAGKRAVDEVLAKSLAEVLGSTPSFWLQRQAVYENQVAKFQKRARPDENLAWVDEIPYRDLTKQGWVETTGSKAEQVTDLLRFFAVPTVDAWRAQYGAVFNAVAYRSSQSFESEPGAIATWLRCCEIAAGAIKCETWNPNAFRKSLQEIRRLTLIEDPYEFVPRLQQICAASGVAVVVVKAPTGCRASGATRFLTPGHAILMLSFRHLSDDHFWFSFFHEAGHLLLHGDRLFIEFENGDRLTAAEEIQANEFAEGLLIPSKEELLRLPTELRPILRFARDAGISPGIVVGQLQHYRRVKRNHFNKLKRRYTWRDDD